MGLRGEDESSYNERKLKKVKRAMTCPSKEHHKRASIQWPLWHVALHRFANLYFLLSDQEPVRWLVSGLINSSGAGLL